jgi:hypothetical protein
MTMPTAPVNPYTKPLNPGGGASKPSGFRKEKDDPKYHQQKK